MIKINLSQISDILCDPITKKKITNFENVHISNIDKIQKYFTLREIDLYKVVQKNGVKSYNDDGPVGNFSHDDYEPSKLLGCRLKNFSGLFLDVGCGLMGSPIYMKMSSPPLVWIGMDPVMQSLSSFYSEREFCFIQGFGEFLPFTDNSLDGIVFSSTIDHQIRPEKSLCEAHRVLKPGGSIHVVETARSIDFVYTKWILSKKFLGASIYNKFHCQAFTKKRLERMMRKAKFVIYDISYFHKDELYIFGKK